MKWILTNLFIVFCLSASAQFFNNWYFGNRAGVSFGANGVNLLLDSGMEQLEGVASISDANGDILFYTDGIRVYNAKDSTMPNGTGLKGNRTTTMSGFIVPWIGNSTKYFVFSLEPQGADGGVRYSVVDMTKDNGFGDVDTIMKNVPLLNKACEKIIAVQHALDSAIWVIVHPYNFDGYYSYKVSQSGIDSIPVVSQGGVFIGPNAVSGNCIGYLTASLDGTKLAAAHRHIDRVEIMDFDAATGQISNFQVLDTNYVFFGPYGVEFSPNNRFLYVNETNGFIYQYDLQNPNPATSREILAVALDSTIDSYGAIQIGPDSMLYVARGDKRYLSRIENPDLLGTAASFVDAAIQLDTATNSFRTSRFGLPKNIPNYQPYYDIDFSGTCLGDSTLFIAPLLTFDSIWWNFDDPLSGANNFSSRTNPNHMFTNTGTYTVTVYLYVGNSVFNYSRTVTIKTAVVEILGVRDACEGESVYLYVQGDYDKIQWSTGQQGDSILVPATGSYRVSVLKNGCFDADTVFQQFEKAPTFSLGPDTTLCKGDSVLIGVLYPNYTSTWNDARTDSLRWVSEPGFYALTISSDLCSTTRSIKIDVLGCGAVLELPNVFSPNNDGTNDYFMPRNMDNIVELEVLIYNRWGSLVHQSNDVNLSWDGTGPDGKTVAAGVYYWVARYVDTLDDEAIQNGSVTLVY